MTKGNPLFVDSTKLTTDTLAAHFDLKGKLIEESQEMYLKVVDASGVEHSQKMQLSDDDVFQCQIWLNHQQEVRLQFIVLGSEGIVDSSVIFKDRVTYLMEYNWKPADNDEVIDLYKKVEANSTKSDSEEPDKVFGEVEEMSALIDKWGL